MIYELYIVCSAFYKDPQELVRDIVVTVNGDEADVIQEEVNVATSLLMWSQVLH